MVSADRELIRQALIAYQQVAIKWGGLLANKDQDLAIEARDAFDCLSIRLAQVARDLREIKRLCDGAVSDRYASSYKLAERALMMLEHDEKTYCGGCSVEAEVPHYECGSSGVLVYADRDRDD